MMNDSRIINRLSINHPREGSSDAGAQATTPVPWGSPGVLEGPARALVAEGYSIVRGTGWISASISSIAPHWNDLPVDRFLKERATFRRRRFGRYRLDLTSATVAAEAPGFFEQPKAINAYAGGIARVFDPLTQDLAGSAHLHNLILYFGGVIRAATEIRRWRVNVHAIRITATPGEAGLPTPEGIHRDGHDYVAMILVHRDRSLRGGRSSIYADDGRRLLSLTLFRPGKAILVDDRRVLHGVSPIRPAGASQFIHRDMIIIDYNREVT
jgi:hypothetical protein